MQNVLYFSYSLDHYCDPESFDHITLKAQSTKLLKQLPYLLYGFCHQLIHFSITAIKQLVLCFYSFVQLPHSQEA